MIDNTLSPLASGQERLWFLQRLDPRDRSYQFQSTITFNGALDVDALERALNGVVARHDSFRTSFEAIGGVPVARVAPTHTVTLPLVDLHANAPVDERALSAAVDAAIAAPFDISRLPLVRWTLVRVAADRHVLVHVEHHLIHDGWSFYVFLNELAAHYRHFADGAPLGLDPAPEFSAFARAQRAAADSSAATAGLTYWKETLAGAPALLNLSTDRSRPPIQTHEGDAIIRHFAPATLRALEALSRTHGVTVYMALLSAFAVLLQRYSGDDDICIGTGVAGRDTPESERLIGMLVNNVIVRLDVSGDPTYLELLRRVKTSAIGAYTHQHVSLDRVVNAVSPTRDPSFNPIFTTMFSFHDSPFPTLDFGALDVTLDQTVDNASAKMDLNVIGLPHAGGMIFKWEFNRDLFDRATMERMFDHFEVLLAGIIEEPERRVSRFSLMSAAERQTIITAFARNVQPYERDTSVAMLFARVAAAIPDATALVSDGVRVPYAELDARANRLARYLQRSGVAHATRVGLLFDRSVDAIVAMLAVLKAGAVYVPITPRYPAERIALILSDADVALTLTRSVDRALLPASAAVIEVDVCAAQIDAEPALRPDGVHDASDLAYIMYTSGSTGTPKGACVTQRGIVRLAAPCTAVAIAASDIVANYSSNAFDASTYEIWGALLNGATLAIVPSGMLSLAELKSTYGRLGVTVAFLTTPLFHQMVETQLDVFRSLRLVIAGGDVLSPAHARRFVDSVPTCRLVNAYGPTENTAFTTTYDVTPATPAATSIPLGRPLANTSVYVLDTHGKPVPVDVPGEIFTGGDGVARGYCNRPELTAQRFVADTFASAPDAVLYRTGDRGRWRADGTLEYLGRRDDQVKVRGFRIELRAIESALLAHPQIREAAVTVAISPDGEKLLVAHVVPAPGSGVDQQLLRTFLAERLPDYEIPSRITLLTELPAGVSGKIDRMRLQPLPSGAVGQAEAAAQPALIGAVEVELGALWMRTLDLRHVNRHDDFFALGGHSLLAMRLLARINATFGVDVALHEMFEHRTIATLAQAIARAPHQAKPEIVATPTHRSTSGDVAALSDAEIDALLNGYLGQAERIETRDRSAN